MNLYFLDFELLNFIDGLKSRNKKEKGKTNNILMLHCGIISGFKGKKKKGRKRMLCDGWTLARLMVKLFPNKLV